MSLISGRRSGKTLMVAALFNRRIRGGRFGVLRRGLYAAVKGVA